MSAQGLCGATHLALNNVGVHLAGGDVVVASERHVQVALVVAQVEVGLTAVVENVHLT